MLRSVSHVQLLVNGRKNTGLENMGMTQPGTIVTGKKKGYFGNKTMMSFYVTAI